MDHRTRNSPNDFDIPVFTVHDQEDLARPDASAGQSRDVYLVRDEQHSLALRQGIEKRSHVICLFLCRRSIPEERIEGWKIHWHSHVEQFGGFAASAPLARQDSIKDDTGIVQRLADGSRLVASTTVEISLRIAIIELEIGRVARTGRDCMAHDCVNARLLQEFKHGCCISSGR